MSKYLKSILVGSAVGVIGIYATKLIYIQQGNPILEAKEKVLQDTADRIVNRIMN